MFAIFGRIILSWFPIDSTSPLSGVRAFLFRITEPVLGPIRRMVPFVRIGAAGALDLSPIIVVLVLQLLVMPLVC
jgi:YggT family protein